jgi:hypothetical protein
MPLDLRRESILQIYCYMYEKLIKQLNNFDEILSQATPEHDCYSITKECFDPAIQEFGSNPPQIDDKNQLIEDLINKIGGLFVYKFSSNGDLLKSFNDFKDDVYNDMVFSLSKMDEFHELGKKISLECYSSFCSADYGGLKRATRINIEPNNTSEISCIPKKIEGTTDIYVKFGTDDFYLKKFVNLPFAFSHEYISHIHSANLFNETSLEHNCSFADGWLIYVAYRKYKKHLQADIANMDVLSHREHYLKSYIYDITSESAENRYVRKGYDLAEKFGEIVGEDSLDKVSFLLSTTDYDSIPAHTPLHTKSMFIINTWINHHLKKGENEKKEEIELFNLALEDEEPLKNLLDIMS